MKLGDVFGLMLGESVSPEANDHTGGAHVWKPEGKEYWPNPYNTDGNSFSTDGNRVEGEAECDKPIRPALPFLLIPVAIFWASLCFEEEVYWEFYAGSGALYDIGCSMRSFIASASAGWATGSAANSYIGNAVLLTAVFLMVLAVASALALIFLKRKGFSYSVPIAMMVACCLGVLVGSLCWGSFHSSAEMLSGAHGPYQLSVLSDPMRTSTSIYSIAELETQDGSPVKARVKVIWDSESEVLPLGSSFKAKGKFTKLGNKQRLQYQHRQLVAGSFNPYSIYEVGWASSAQGLLGPLRNRCDESISSVGGDGSALMRGITLGNRSALDGTDVDEAFKLTGLAHLIAVSGSHLSVMAALTTWVLRRMKLPRWLLVALTSASACIYLVFTGLQASAFRSCIMAVASSLSWSAGRRSSSLSSLVIAVAIMLALDPSNAFSTGFALSVLGVGGLCIFLPLVTYWIEALVPRRARSIAQPIAMTATAQAATMPVSVPLFSMVSVISPVSNVLVSPPIAFFLGAGLTSLVMLVLIEPVGSVMIYVLCKMGDILAEFVLAISHIPFVALPVYEDGLLAALVTIACAVALWIFWPCPSIGRIRKILAGLASALLGAALLIGPDMRDQVVVMDVGQGDAILVRSGGRQILVDTGQYDSSLRAALGRNHVYHLDAVVLTHFDADHCGALGAMNSMVDVDSVVVAKGSLALAQNDEQAADVAGTACALVGEEDNVVEVVAGDAISLSDKVNLSVVWPDGEITESDNATSICMYVNYDADNDGVCEFKVLLTGDAEKEQLKDIAEDGNSRDIDVLKVGHHGSAIAVDDEVLDVFKPEVALISVGADNRYGHPKQNTIDALENHGIKVLRTDENGDITVTFDGASMDVACDNI